MQKEHENQERGAACETLSSGPDRAVTVTNSQQLRLSTLGLSDTVIYGEGLGSLAPPPGNHWLLWEGDVIVVSGGPCSSK